MKTDTKDKETLLVSSNILQLNNYKKRVRLKKEIEEINELIGALQYSIIKLNKHSRYRKIQYHVNELHDTKKKLQSFLEDKKSNLDYLEKTI